MFRVGVVETVIRIFEWFSTNEAGLSGLAALVVILGVLFSPIGAGLRAVFRGKQPGEFSPPGLQSERHARSATSKPVHRRPAARSPANSMIGAAGAAAVAAMASRPSIAVLPFANMMGKLDYDHVAEGITDDMMTGLARLAHFPVIARAASRAYAGEPEHPREVAAKLGARYLVEGRLRRTGGRMRIAVQLIDGASGDQLWADHFDQPLGEIDDGQDEIVAQIMGALQDQLRAAEGTRAARKEIDDLDAWELVMRGYVELDGFTGSENVARAEELARQAIEREPENGGGYILLASALIGRNGGLTTQGGEERMRELRREVEEAADRAVQLSPRDPLVLGTYGHVKVMLEQDALAIPILERAIQVDPSNARAWGTLGRALRNVGRYDDAVTKLEHALRLGAREHMAFLWSNWLGTCHIHLGNYQEALQAAEVASGQAPQFIWTWLVMASALGHLGRTQDAATALARAKDVVGKDLLTAETVERTVHASLRHGPGAESLLAGLAAAGLE